MHKHKMLANDTFFFLLVSNTENRESSKTIFTIYVLGLTNDSFIIRQANVKFWHCILPTQIHIIGTAWNQQMKLKLEETTLDKDLAVCSDPELKFSKHAER